MKTIGLRETWYFGLQFVDSSDLTGWLKLDKKVSSVCVIHTCIHVQRSAISIVTVLVFAVQTMQP